MGKKHDIPRRRYYGDGKAPRQPGKDPKSAKRPLQEPPNYNKVTPIWKSPVFVPLPYADPRKPPIKRCLLRPKKGFYEKEELVHYCVTLLQNRCRKYEIKRRLYGWIEDMGFIPPSHVGFERILSKARAELRLNIEQAREDHQADAYETMLKIIQDPMASNTDKIKAQAVINELLGLTARYSPERANEAEEKMQKIRALLDNEAPAVDDPDPLKDEDDNAEDNEEQDQT